MGGTDGQAKDVTLRYAGDYYARGFKERLTPSPGQMSWWQSALIGTRTRPYLLVRFARSRYLVY